MLPDMGHLARGLLNEWERFAMMYRGLALLAFLGFAARAECDVKIKTEPNTKAPIYSAHNDPICLLPGAPPAEVRYEVLGRVLATKRTYGSVDELSTPMIREAQKLGADALISFEVGQRFKGPLPWRLTSPTGVGTAIKVLPESPKLDCIQAGGKFSVAPVQPSASPQGAVIPTQTPAGLPQKQSDSERRETYADLERLKKMLDEGTLTQEEFDREKAKLLH
jgi:hypothetical protein